MRIFWSALSMIPVFAIRAYKKLLSPLLGTHCRFYPSCSSYAEQAFLQKGFLKGSLLALKRILKCHPLHPGGVDCLE